jgi:transposase
MPFAAVDLHRRRSQIAVLDDDGVELWNRNAPNRSPQMLALLESLPAGTPVAVEATYGWAWLVDLLAEMGLDARLAHPGGCKAIAHARLKNDKVDARTLAHLLRTDLLPEAWLAPPAVRELRALLRHRAALVGLRTGLKGRVRGVLGERGIVAPDSLWTRPGRAWLGQLPLPATHRLIVDNACSLLDAVTAVIQDVEKEIRRRAQPDPRVEALMTIHGIGLITAMTLVAEIGDVHRFRTARKLCCWAGLTPRVRNSDTTVRHGPVSKMGSPVLRWVLGEAAQVAKRKPPYAEAYLDIAKRRGKNIATTAIARRLLARAFHILHDLEPESAPVPQEAGPIVG